MKRAIALPLLAALATLAPFAPCAIGAAPRLYDTGPAQDLALVRFVNAGTQPLTVKSGGNGSASASLVVAPDAPVTDYQPARSDAPVTGQWQLGGRTLPISLRVKAGGSASAVAWADESGQLAGASFIEARRSSTRSAHRSPSTTPTRAAPPPRSRPHRRALPPRRARPASPSSRTRPRLPPRAAPSTR
jgi:hypothetical protein